MKKYSFLALLLVLGIFAIHTPAAHAQTQSMDANYWIRVQEANDPVYNHTNYYGNTGDYGYTNYSGYSNFTTNYNTPNYSNYGTYNAPYNTGYMYFPTPQYQVPAYYGYSPNYGLNTSYQGTNRSKTPRGHRSY